MSASTGRADLQPRFGVIAVVAAMTLVQALVTMAVLAMPAVAPELAAAHGVPSSLIGYQISLVYAAAMIASAAGGTLVARWGACRTSQLCLGLAVLACLLVVLPSLAALALGSLVLGVAYGLPNPAASHLLSRFTSARNRNLVFSIKQTGVPLGGMAAGLVAPPLALAFGWQAALIAVAVPTALLLLLLQGARADWDADRNPSVRLTRSPLAGLGAVWRQPALRWLSLMGFCFAGIQLCLMTFLVVLLVEEGGFDLITAGLLLAVIQFSGAGGRIFWGWLADRVQDGFFVLLLLAGVMLAACVVTGTSFGRWPWLPIAVTFLLFGVSAIGWNGVFLAEVARLSPGGQVGINTGSAMFYTYAGVMVAPSAFSFSYGLIGSYATTFGLLGAVALLGFGLVLLARRAARPA